VGETHRFAAVGFTHPTFLAAGNRRCNCRALLHTAIRSPPLTAALPGAVLRVGVTGTRTFAGGPPAHLGERITGLLGAIRARAARDGVAARLTLVSPLAEGADRLVAELALKAGYELVCPLPFPRDEYVHDFATADSRADFERLLAQANGRVLALDGQRGDEADRCYEAVGRLVVRNCDLLIGIWDGHVGGGRGGAADTIRYSASFGPPVVWLHATDPDAAPRWIEEAHDLRHGATAHAAADRLGPYLDRLLTPPAAPRHSGQHSLLHSSAHLARTRCEAALRRMAGRPPASPLTTYLNERRHPAWGPWLLHGWLIRVLSGGHKAPWTEPRPPTEPLARAWFDRYQPADERATEYAKRYRSSYVWAFLLAAVALVGAAVALTMHQWEGRKAIATGLELAALVLILALVLTDGMVGWQRRALEYRLLAELCRKQQALAPLGWSVPRAGAWATTAAQDGGAGDPAAWVGWLFSAWLRETPLPTGTLDKDRVDAARQAALRDLIDDQIAYHDAREAQYRSAGGRLVIAGEVLFVLVLLLVGCKLWLLRGSPPDGWLVGLGLAGAILPALSAAFVGIRAYAELELLAEQSRAMLKTMCHAGDQIKELDPAAPIASQALGSALAAVVTSMLEDLQGWALLVRAKVVEG
jgi:hypothetical protein